MNLERFLEQNNGLVIGTEVTSHYQLIYIQTDEVWGTFKSPAEPSDIEDITREIADGLPMGTNQFRLQAITSAGTIRAQCSLVIEGRNAAVKKPQSAASDLSHHTRALKANVDVSEQQLNSMAARLQVSEERMTAAESRCANMMKDGYAMMDLVNRLISDKEDQRRQEELHEARMANVKLVGMALSPILQPFVELIQEAVQDKMKDFKRKKEEAKEAEERTH